MKKEKYIQSSYGKKKTLGWLLEEILKNLKLIENLVFQSKEIERA
jgi:hypothetical protein